MSPEADDARTTHPVLDAAERVRETDARLCARRDEGAARNETRAATTAGVDMT